MNYAKSFSETDNESSFALVSYDWIMQTVYYTTVNLEALQASLLETNVYLLFLAAILDLASRWHPPPPPPPPPPPTPPPTPPTPPPPHPHPPTPGFVTLKFVGLKVLL